VDRQIRRLGLALVALFLLLVGQVSNLQVFAADRIANDPANATRQLIAEYRVDRGSILAADGTTVLAFSRKSRGQLVYERRYPQGPLFAGVTGFYSLVFGKSGLEFSMNPFLSGDAAELTTQTLSDLVLGRPKKGGTIVTTIVPELQQIAEQALAEALPENGSGAVVALNPQTGDVLSMVSIPTFDPNPLSAQDPELIRKTWDQDNDDPSRPLVNRAVGELYPPGSTFKLITASAALEHGATLDTTYPNPHELDLPLTSETIENFGGSSCPGSSTTTLLTAFTNSCNVIFGEIGLQLGPERLAEQARAFGFCATNPPDQTGCLEPTVPFSVPFQSGRFPVPEYFQGRDPAVAISAIGQDNDLANPMQMALVGAAIANEGVEMAPRLVTEVRDAKGRLVKRFQPSIFGRPISPSTASTMTHMMENVVNVGTGQDADSSCVQVAGKTGTAQHGEGVAPHAWFVSFAPADNPQIVVAVVVLDGGSLGSEATGGHVAAPIAKQIIEAYVEECG
jgi:peptidoglycan glycosyltransferase